MDCARGCQDYRAAGSKRQADQTLAGDFEIGFGVRSDLDDAACARERGGDVKVAVGVEGHALRPAETFIEGGDRAVGIDLENAVVRSGDEKFAVRAERKVIG